MKPQSGQVRGDSLAQERVVRIPLVLRVEDYKRVLDHRDHRNSSLPGLVSDLLQGLEGMDRDKVANLHEALATLVGVMEAGHLEAPFFFAKA